MNNLEEMGKFLGMYSLPKVNREEIENMNRPISSNQIQLVTKKFPTNKSPGLDGFTGELYQMFKKSQHLSFWNYFKILQRKEHFWHHSRRPPSPWYQNQRKISHKKRKLKANITDEHRCKNAQQNIQMIH